MALLTGHVVENLDMIANSEKAERCANLMVMKQPTLGLVKTGTIKETLAVIITKKITLFLSSQFRTPFIDVFYFNLLRLAPSFKFGDCD